MPLVSSVPMRRTGMGETREEFACYVKGMHPILKRILANGLLAAGMLAVIGYGFAELSSLWLAAQTPARGAREVPVAARPNEDASTAFKYRIPAMMALWGFLFVAAGEGIRYFIRGNRQTSVTKQSEVRPDPAEVLLEQIL